MTATITLNDRHQVMSVYTSPCGKCKYFDSVEFSCRAFPGGIPDELLEGKWKHDIPLKGQRGTTVFELRSMK